MKKFFTLLTLFFTFAVITNAQETPFFEQTFETDLGDMATYSVVGDQVWEWGNYGEPEGCATMTGHVHPDDFANEDWLITPALDFTGKTNVAFSFMEAINYESSIEDNEKVYISTDYDGTGNPNNFTWEQLTVTNRASGEDWSFVTVDDIDLSAYDEESTVYIAFKFTCTDAGSGTWEIDNIAVFEDLNLPELVVTEPMATKYSNREKTWKSPGHLKISQIM